MTYWADQGPRPRTASRRRSTWVAGLSCESSSWRPPPAISLLVSIRYSALLRVNSSGEGCAERPSTPLPPAREISRRRRRCANGRLTCWPIIAQTSPSKTSAVCGTRRPSRRRTSRPMERILRTRSSNAAGSCPSPSRRRTSRCARAISAGPGDRDDSTRQRTLRRRNASDSMAGVSSNHMARRKTLPRTSSVGLSGSRPW